MPIDEASFKELLAQALAPIHEEIASLRQEVGLLRSAIAGMAAPKEEKISDVFLPPGQVVLELAKFSIQVSTDTLGRWRREGYMKTGYHWTDRSRGEHVKAYYRPDAIAEFARTPQHERKVYKSELKKL